MWDGKIEAEYRSQHGNKYQSHRFFAKVFLPRMQEELLEAIDDYADMHHLDTKRAIFGVRQTLGDRSPAKVLDEFNWLRYTREEL